jgi:hypothetical protein
MFSSKRSQRSQRYRIPKSLFSIEKTHEKDKIEMNLASLLDMMVNKPFQINIINMVQGQEQTDFGKLLKETLKLTKPSDHKYIDDLFNNTGKYSLFNIKIKYVYDTFNKVDLKGRIIKLKNYSHQQI